MSCQYHLYVAAQDNPGVYVKVTDPHTYITKPGANILQATGTFPLRAAYNWKEKPVMFVALPGSDEDCWGYTFATWYIAESDELFNKLTGSDIEKIHYLEKQGQSAGGVNPLFGYELLEDSWLAEQIRNAANNAPRWLLYLLLVNGANDARLAYKNGINIRRGAGVAAGSVAAVLLLNKKN